MPTPSARILLSLTGLLTGCYASKAGSAAPEAPVAEAATPAPAPAPPRTFARSNQAWWPEQVDLSPLRDNAVAGPNGADHDYAEAFAKLDYKALKAEIAAVLTDSQDWWPADYGTYGPLFIRLAWHSSGTYRVMDGRPGRLGLLPAQRRACGGLASGQRGEVSTWGFAARSRGLPGRPWN